MPTSRRRSGPGPAANLRQQAREQQRLAAAAARRRRIRLQIGVVAAVALLVVGIVTTAVVLGQRSAPTAADGARPVVDTTVTLGSTRVPLAVDGSAVRLGRADAPAKVDLWVDYSCPHCQEYEAANADVLNGLVERGDVSVSYHNIRFVSDYGLAAGSAAACVAAEDPQRWPAFNTALYANHSSATDGWSAADFRDFAQQQGVTGAALDCVAEGRYEGWIKANTSDADARGVTATPTLMLDGAVVPTVGGEELVNQVTQRARG